eukprot:TRINITY_DN1520_c0_g2_i4.p1 TRINITY_DN1520_c0_g2~~TRINITY_DN1520_c0_g2_i4.p1  ORF type:complete len:110 (-),score=55.39 TRINITY_DN1520_c0_g2_i4:137-466(-)
MTVEAYQSLYESSIAYGMRKALLAEQRRNDLETEMQDLENECSELQQSVSGLEGSIVDIEKEFAETKENLAHKHEEIVKEGKLRNKALKEELERLLSAVPPKDPDKKKK